MNDYILSGTIGGYARAYISVTTETVNKAFEIHQTSPVASAALGRMLTAAAIMGSMLKNETDLVTLIVKGDGPLQGVVATADSKARVKGYAYENDVDYPLNENGKLDVGGAIGSGYLNVIRDIGLREPYSGQIELVSGEIAEDLTHYFAVSEQVPSVVALGVLVDRDLSIKNSGGFILQLMPGAPDEFIEHLEASITQMESVTTILENGLSPYDILHRLANGLEYEPNETIPVEYYCNCDKARVTKALVSVGREELTDILENDKQAQLHCHFCGKDYFFDERELREILDEA